jgi:hypothetical protein
MGEETFLEKAEISTEGLGPEANTVYFWER